MACAHSLAAVRNGMAECTPNLRAAYEAAETTPRSSRCPPTTTGLPFNEGSNNSSTETKNASISTWKIVRDEVEDRVDDNVEDEEELLIGVPVRLTVRLRGCQAKVYLI